MFEAGTHLNDAFALGSKGDNDAAMWAGTAAVALGAAGVISGVSASAAIGATWAVGSALAFTGVGLIAIVGALLLIGLGALYMKMTSQDRPLGVWVSKTIFGNPRTGFFGGAIKNSTYLNLSEELKGYYLTSYNPIEMDGAKDILTDKAETDWEEHGIKRDQAKFTFLLPGYVNGMSTWGCKLEGYDGRNVNSDEDRETTKITEPNRPYTLHEMTMKKEGLYVYLSGTFEQFNTDSAGLEITYNPQGKDHEPVIHYLYVDD